MSHRSIHIFISGDAQDHTYIAKEGGNDHALNDNQFQNVPRFSTNGLTNTELVSSLFHRDKHDVRYAHDTREQCQKSNHPKRRMDNFYRQIHLKTLSVVITNPNSTFIFWMNMVILIQTLAIGLLKF